MELRSDKDINLYKALKNVKAKNNNEPGKIRWILPPVLIVLILGGAFAYLFLQNNRLQKEADQIKAYINNEEIKRQYKESQELQALQQKLNEEKKRLESFEKIITTYPELNKDIFTKIEESTKSKIVIFDISYVGASGIISMSASAEDIGSASEFIQSLMSTSLFTKVNYNGWNLGSNGRYTFNVVCVLKADNQGVSE